MDKATIDRILQLASAARELPIPVQHPAVILPEGSQVQSLEHLLEAPLRMRRVYRTERLADFCHYVKAESDVDNSAVFVLPDGSGAEAVIDYGRHEQPAWGHHRAELKLRYTAEFAALNKLDGLALTQRDMIEYLEDWGHILTPYRGQETLSLAKAIGAIRRVDITQSTSSHHEQGDWSAARSRLEQIEARSGGEAMPEGFRATCQAYPHTEPRTITVRLSLLTGGDTPRLCPRIVGRELLMQQIAEEIEQKIGNELTGIRTFVGAVGIA